MNYSRVDINNIKKIANKLSLDIIEDSSSVLEVSLPSSIFSNENRISTKICFDVKNETLNSIETIDFSSEGDTIKTSYYPVYQEIYDEPIKVGTITIVEEQKNKLIEGVNQIEYFESLDFEFIEQAYKEIRN